ncbi:MAG: 3-phosphoshikimate 1-carboxyvinyltransferase [Gemmatimonadota bacterium]
MEIRVPGDKSLTQRALILGALSEGTARLSGLLHGGDADSTAGALRALGVPIPELLPEGGEISFPGVGLGGLREPRGHLDLGNSGTGTRLLLGVLAGSDVKAIVTGDASLRARPMARVTRPLTAMGARFRFLEEEGRLPVEVQGTRALRPVDWPSPVASAQVKSALLLAGLTGHAAVQVTEPRRSRDHTERMLRALGVSVLGHAVEGGWRVEMRDPPPRLGELNFRVPGDPSSAAFFVALALLGGTSGPLTVLDVGLNPTRTAFFDVARRMRGRVDVRPRPSADAFRSGSDVGEPVGNLLVRPGPLRGVSLGEGSGEEIPSLIDELPLVAVLGARAAGATRVRGAADLRHKESDRIHAMVEGLRAVGVEARELPDGFEVVGSDRHLEGEVRTYGDHRIAMAFAVLGASPGTSISVDDPGAADVSFPGFWELLKRVAAEEPSP